MAESERLEARLLDLAGAIEWPAAPDLRRAVWAGIARRRRRRLRLLLIAAALGAVLMGGAVAATYVELRGAAIQQVPRLPSPSPLPPGSLGVRLDLGDRYPTLAEGQRAAGFRVLVPGALGEPDEVFWRASPGVLTLVYRPRAGLPASSDPEVGALVMEAKTTLNSNAFLKLAGPGTHIQPVTVNGGGGFWITGVPHGFVIYGSGQGDSFRLAGDVLLWNQAGLVVRIESSLDERRALEVAGTAR